MKSLSIFTRLALLALISIGTVLPALEAAAQNRSSGLPLPRFVTFRADEVNMRAGPGVQYPVEWVYKRQGLPAEIIAEYGTWRKVRDWQGTQGWIHQSMLSGKRNFVIIGSDRTIRKSPDSESDPRARAEPGVIGKFLECEGTSSWCKVEISGLSGWLRRVDVWGVYRGEELK